ncbi:cation transporting ATPase C-terminal domain-containing protein [Micromonospora sp. DT229]|uniref:cation-translocating P-type ATPase C-terminal domain-containing protein n=1 Tax=Micromonospora sp. DT229 TaxID=3393430 RepID=UPI003CE87FD7
MSTDTVTRQVTPGGLSCAEAVQRLRRDGPNTTEAPPRRLTHGLPGVALGAEPAEPGTLRRAPRAPQESVLGAGLGRHILVAGALISAVTLGAGVLAAHWERPWQSVVFVVLGLAQLGVALAVRAPRPPGGRRDNPALPLAVAVSALLQVAGVLVAPLRDLLGTQPLGGRGPARLRGGERAARSDAPADDAESSGSVAVTWRDGSG